MQVVARAAPAHWTWGQQALTSSAAAAFTGCGFSLLLRMVRTSHQVPATMGTATRRCGNALRSSLWTSSRKMDIHMGHDAQWRSAFSSG